MENLIQFMDFEQGSRGRQLGENSVSVWYNLNGKNKTYGVTFSQDIDSDKTLVRIGKIGDSMCFVFTNETGIRLQNRNQPKKNMGFFAKSFVEYILPELKTATTGKKRKVFTLKKVSDDIYIINQ